MLNCNLLAAGFAADPSAQPLNLSCGTIGVVWNSCDAAVWRTAVCVAALVLSTGIYASHTFARQSE